MKRVLAIMILSMALPLCAMDGAAQEGVGSRVWKAGVVFADMVAERLLNGTWEVPQEDSTASSSTIAFISGDAVQGSTDSLSPVGDGSSKRTEPRKKLTRTKRKDVERETKRSSQSFNKDLISRTRLSRLLLPTVCVAGAAALVASEHKAHRAGKTTILRRLWRRVRRMVRGETREEVH